MFLDILKEIERDFFKRVFYRYILWSVVFNILLFEFEVFILGVCY